MIRLVSAGAGSGKTYRLTEEIADAVGKRDVPPECVVATTFTVKAANEIKERVRAKLLKHGLGEKAQAMGDSLVGTVHSICGRLLSIYCFESGLSPDATIIPEEESVRLFQMAVSEVIEAGAIRLGPVLRRLSMDVDIGSKNTKMGAKSDDDWRGTVRKVISFARSNGISAEQLPTFADRSWSSFQQLLPAPIPGTGEKLDACLVEAIRDSLPQLERNIQEIDLTKGTKEFLISLRKLESLLRLPEEITWSSWEALARPKIGARSKNIVKAMQNAASKHTLHHRFHSDLERYIKDTFACAAEAMMQYSAYKSANGLLDFEDQESLALALLHSNDTDVRDGLREMIKLVLVDEFQDTNPIQLAIFLELASIAPESIWVGDQKQSIFGFRGTDPRLMDAVIEKVIAPDDFDILPNNWRSRVELIEFFNAFFSRSFARYKHEEERVVLKPTRTDAPQGMSPLQLWKLQCEKVEEQFAALASGVANMLSRCETIQVYDKREGESRELRAGDVAILCRSNKDVARIVTELSKRGIRASLGGGGLLQRPECVIAYAALRYLVNALDTVALAELVHYTSGTEPGQWLSAFLEGKRDELGAACPHIEALDAVRARLIQLTPCEALDLACEVIRLDAIINAWGDAGRRSRSIEQLRGLALVYEDTCRARRSACTSTGLINFLLDSQNIEKFGVTESFDEDSVAVMTYHKSKGLEWPVVILTNLESAPKARIFGVVAEPSPEPFDPATPLNGRWIRCWPWPYGKRKRCSFDDSIHSSPEGVSALDNEERERLRLMYVGMTRARDYLILAAGEKKDKLNVGWLDSLLGPDGNSILSFSESETLSSFDVAGAQFPADIRSYSSGDGLIDHPLRVNRMFAEMERPETQILPARLSPSKAVAIDSEVKIKVYDLGERLLEDSTENMVDVGEAVHSFLCVDRADVPWVDRVQTAHEILARWSVAALQPEQLVVAADRLYQFIITHYGASSVIRREWPIHLRQGIQQVSGWIDMIVETPHGWVIVDHKSFPGQKRDLLERARHHAPQLELYRKSLEKAFGALPRELLLHFPLIGSMVSLQA